MYRKFQNFLSNVSFARRKLSFFSISEDYYAIYKSKLASYRLISDKKPVREGITNLHKSLKNERRLIDKKLRKIISQIDFDFLGEILGRETNEFIKLKKIILDYSDKIPSIVKLYDMKILEFENKYMTKDFLKGVPNLDREEIEKLREEIGLLLRNLKSLVDSVFDYDLQKEVNDIVSYFQSRKFAENKLERVVQICNSYSKEFKSGVAEFTMPVLYTSLNMAVVRFLTENYGLVDNLSSLTETKQEFVNLVISWVVVLISFYGTAFVNMYRNNLAKYQGNLQALFSDYLQMYTSVFIIGYGVGGTTFAAFDISLQEFVNLDSKSSVFLANVLASFFIVGLNSPIRMATSSIKAKIKEISVNSEVNNIKN